MSFLEFWWRRFTVSLCIVFTIVYDLLDIAIAQGCAVKDSHNDDAGSSGWYRS